LTPHGVYRVARGDHVEATPSHPGERVTGEPTKI
jgi:hypothetical protein